MSNSNFKLYDPIEDTIAKVNAGDAGSGGVPSTGGTFTGNVTMQQPAKILQCEAPTGSCDLVNKGYIDSLVGTTPGPFLPLSGGTMAGAIIQPLAPSAANQLANKAYVDSVVPSGAPDATTSSKGIIKLDGDLSGVASAPTIGANKVTYAKMQQVTGAKKLLGSQTATSNVAELGLGAGLDIAGGNLVLDQTTLNKAGNAQFGVVEFDPTTGDLTETATNSGIASIGANKVTYGKMQQAGASTLLGNPTGAAANVQEIALGSLSFNGNTLNSPVSFYSGTDPNITNPVDRPAINNTLYMGTDNNLWVWKNPYYISLTPKKLLAFAKNSATQVLNTNSSVQFQNLNIINYTSTQGLDIVDSNNGSIFTITLTTPNTQVFLKMTVSISGVTPSPPPLQSTAAFFTYQLETSSYTGPGIILNTTSNSPSSTHIYSEILFPTSTSQTTIEIRLTSGSCIINNHPNNPNAYSWILFEEL